MPLEGDATFDGRPAGWWVYPPGSAHRPTVAQGRALVLYLLPEGAIQFTGNCEPTMMTELLPNYVAGRWQAGTGAGTPLFDPVLGTELARVDATGLDLAGGLRLRARAGRRRAARADLPRSAAALLARDRQGAAGQPRRLLRDRHGQPRHRARTTRRSTSTARIYTLGQYAKWGEALGDARAPADGERGKLGKDAVFQSQHVLVPTRGVALFINAFNFPAWGLWEKAAPALLSGVPVIVKPATATAWLAQRMVQDVVEAGMLPAGALSVVCGGSAGLLDQLAAFRRRLLHRLGRDRRA